MLYPVGSGDGTALQGKKRLEWLESVSEVTAALLPPAYGIAEEKGGGTTRLDQIAQRHEAGLRAWEAGDIDLAEEVITAAYRDLQTEVAALRSGDLLTIDLPSNDTREAWLEAERRYLDWRFTADWMEQSAAAMGADPEAIATGSRLAQEIYDQAAAHAARGEWAAAVEALDRAYAVMEEYWRLAGIDI
jgi:tetratricopeptide (TPR) repeat protein